MLNLPKRMYFTHCMHAILLTRKYSEITATIIERRARSMIPIIYTELVIQTAKDLDPDYMEAIFSGSVNSGMFGASKQPAQVYKRHICLYERCEYLLPFFQSALNQKLFRH